MKEELQALRYFTNGCRDDMHEPDEQGISASVVGTRLDNAFGDEITPKFLERGHQEIVVCLHRQHENAHIQINLATLIALARKAVL